MKIVVISDSHGRVDYMLKVVEKESADTIFLPETTRKIV